MYTVVLLAVLSSNSDSPNFVHHLHNHHQHTDPMARGWGGNVYYWGGWGCDWFPSGGWYGSGARGVNAWAAYGNHVNGGNTYNGYSAYPVEDYPFWNGYAGFNPNGGGGHTTPIMMCAYHGCPAVTPLPPPVIGPPVAPAVAPTPTPSPTKKSAP